MNSLYLLLLVASENVPINRNAKIVLRCEDTTTGANERGALSACQWGCYRKCLGGRAAQSDAGVKAVDIMITGEELQECLDELPDNCRLHGSIFQYSLLYQHCFGRFKIEEEDSDDKVMTNRVEDPLATAPVLEPKQGLYINLLVPKSKSDMSLYTTTFSPTEISVGFQGEVPTDSCMKDSFYTTEVYSHGSRSVDCSEAPPIKGNGLLGSQNYVRPYFSTNRLDIELSSVASVLSASQIGFSVQDHLIVMRTPSSCYVETPENVFFFSKGNFTLTTGALPRIVGSIILAGAIFLSI